MCRIPQHIYRYMSGRMLIWQNCNELSKFCLLDSFRSCNNCPSKINRTLLHHWAWTFFALFLYEPLQCDFVIWNMNMHLDLIAIFDTGMFRVVCTLYHVGQGWIYHLSYENSDPFACIFNDMAAGERTAGLILGLRPANERRRYKVTPSLICWAQT